LGKLWRGGGVGGSSAGEWSEQQQTTAVVSGRKKGGKEKKRKRKQGRGLLGQEVGLLKANGLGCKVETGALERKLWAKVWFYFSDFLSFLRENKFFWEKFNLLTYLIWVTKVGTLQQASRSS
jgi:hypothetical protein